MKKLDPILASKQTDFFFFNNRVAFIRDKNNNTPIAKSVKFIICIL